MKAAAVLMLAVLLAGCGDPAPRSGEPVLLVSEPDGEGVVTSDGGTPLTKQTPRSGQRGHLTGFVVDDSLRPVVGARVALPGLEIEDMSNDDGSFAFPDLWPGPYRLTAEADGHRRADAVVEVPADEIVRMKFVLERMAPPTPYHETQEFVGFADVATDEITGFTVLFCEMCVFQLSLEPESLTAVIVEAVREGAAGSSFWLYMSPPDSNRRFSSCYPCPNPAWMSVPVEALEGGTEFRLGVEPYASPLPEFNVDFQVFVTTFYHEDPPPGWSVLTAS